MLEEEIYAATSPIWDPDYKQAPPSHLQVALDKTSIPTTAANNAGSNTPNVSQRQFERLTVDKDAPFTSITLGSGSGFGKKPLRDSMGYVYY